MRTNPMRFRSKANQNVIVEFISEAQLRIGETKRLCVVYEREGYFYVRPKAEFYDKFCLDEGPKPS